MLEYLPMRCYVRCVYGFIQISIGRYSLQTGFTFSLMGNVQGSLGSLGFDGVAAGESS